MRAAKGTLVLLSAVPWATAQSECVTYSETTPADAEIVIGMEADFPPYNNIDPQSSQLVGFDVEFTKKVCELANVRCAIVSAPWQSMIPKSFDDLGVSRGDQGKYVFPGKGFLNGWYDCSSGSRNTGPRQQGLAFSNPYTDPNVDTAGFLIKEGGVADAGADTSNLVVALQTGYATSSYFNAQVGAGTYAQPQEIKYYATRDELVAALTSGEADTVFYAKGDIDNMDGLAWSGALVTGWANGVSFMCHPGKAHLIQKLNLGITEMKNSAEWATLCAKYAGIPCDDNKATFAGNKLTAKADIVIGMEAAFAPYNNIGADSLLVGFDVDLTQKVCDLAGVKCAIVTAPWQSMIAKDYGKEPDDLGITAEKQVTKTFPGKGFYNDWFDCTSGCRNTIPRRQSLSYTNPYTDPANDKAGFIVKTGGAASFPNNAAGKKVGLQTAYATSAYYLSKVADGTYAPADSITYPDRAQMMAALDAGTVDAVFYAKSDVTSADMTAGGWEWAGLEVAAWANGIGYMCHPGKLDVVDKLNTGITLLKNSADWATLCAQYPSIPCETNGLTYTPGAAVSAPMPAWTPPTRADIVIGMEADFPPYNDISAASTLVGFDVELTKLVCAAANVNCAIVSVPWQAAIPKKYSDLGSDATHTGKKTYPGKGFHNGWFDCSSGSRNVIPRQQSLAFTNAYTDPNDDKAGFLVKTGGTVLADASTSIVGLQASYATTAYFKSRPEYKPQATMSYDTRADLIGALNSGEVDTIFYGKSDIPDMTGYEWAGEEVQAWTNGIGFMCHPAKADVVAKLNEGIDAVKADAAAWSALCAQYPTIPCDNNRVSFTNKLTMKAEIVIGMEADFAPYNDIDAATSKLVGFDVALTEKVCLKAGVNCAIVTAPWQAMIPKAYEDMGVSRAVQGKKTYPGKGFLGNWFDCSSGSRNTIPRQQSLAFTHPYTDPAVDTAGFLVKAGTTIADDVSGSKIGLQQSYAVTAYYMAQGETYKAAETVYYDTKQLLLDGLAAGEVDAIFYAKSDIADMTGLEWAGQEVAAWANGVGYMCTPSKVAMLDKLNSGLTILKSQKTELQELCGQYPGIRCDLCDKTQAPAPPSGTTGNGSTTDGVTTVIDNSDQTTSPAARGAPGVAAAAVAGVAAWALC